MKKFGCVAYCSLMLVMALISINAQAGMIGDVLTIERLYPNLNSNYQPSAVTTVAAGTSDSINAFVHELVDPEENSIAIDWISSSYFLGSVDIFDGYRFTGFSNPIKSVVISDIFNISLFEINYGYDFITLNFDSSFDSSSFLRLEVEFHPTSVSEPNAIFMFVFCLIAMAGRFFLRKKKV